MNVIKCRFIKGTDQLAYISSRRENKKPQPQQKDKIKTLSTLLLLLSFPSDYLAFHNSLPQEKTNTILTGIVSDSFPVDLLDIPINFRVRLSDGGSAHFNLKNRGDEWRLFPAQ